MANAQIWNAPNILTLARIALVPAMVAAFYLDGHAKNWTTLGIFAAAGITDFFDGYLARAMNIQSKLGQLLDPIADKLLVAAALMMLAWDNQFSGWLIWAAVIILAREILVSGLREFLAQTQVSVPVSQLAKWKTTVQMLALGFLLAGEAGDAVLPYNTEIGITCLWVAAVLTLYTGYDYLRVGLAHVAGDEGS